MSKTDPIQATVTADGSRLHLEDADRQRLKALAGKRVEIRAKGKKRTGKQNRRHFALMRVGAKSLWEDPSESYTLHDELAHGYFALPPCPKTGMRRRRRTPDTETVEFADFTRWCVDKLIEYGADLSEWDRETELMNQ